MMARNKDKGFTLIELVTVIAVLSVLGAFTFSFIDNAVKTYALIKEQSPLYADGAYIMERITRELSDAITVTTATSNELTFTTPRHPPLPLLPLERSAATVTYRRSGSNDLLRNSTIIGRNINVFNASATVDGAITIELQLNSTGDPSIPPFVLRTTIVPNNYPGANYGETGRSFDGNYYETIQ